MYTFSFIVGNSIPKSVKCIHSATKPKPEDLDPDLSNQKSEHCDQEAYTSRRATADGQNPALPIIRNIQ